MGFLHRVWFLTALLPSYGNLPPLVPSLQTINITLFVITMLASANDNLSWETQFISSVIMHQQQGMIDETITKIGSTILVTLKDTQPNPVYYYWLRVDQLIREYFHYLHGYVM